MGLKAKIEAIIYAADEPITLEQISLLVKDIVLAEESAAKARVESIAESEQPETPVSATSEPNEPTPVDDASNGTAVAESAEIAEITEKPAADVNEKSEPIAQVTENPETAAAPAEIATAAEPEPLTQASTAAPGQSAGKRRKPANPEDARVKIRVRAILEELAADYSSEERGMEIRQVAGGFRMATKPEHHDVVRAFARSLKPPVRLSLAALETLAVIAYKQPVTAPEITEIRGVESAGVLGTLLDRKLITTAGRKQVIGRPILYKTSKEFLLRFGLNELSELPSMEEFEKLAIDGQVELFTSPPETPKPEEAETPTPQETATPVPEAETLASEETTIVTSEETAPEVSSAPASAELPASSSPTDEQEPPAPSSEKSAPGAAPADSSENNT